MARRFTRLPVAILVTLSFPAQAVECDARLAEIDARVTHYESRVNDRFELAIDPERLERAPAYVEDRQNPRQTRQWLLAVHQFYGLPVPDALVSGSGADVAVTRMSSGPISRSPAAGKAPTESVGSGGLATGGAGSTPESLDVNGDGRLERTEFAAFHENR